MADTLQVLSAGAVWFVPAATLTVIVALPFALLVTVTVVPLTLTVATLVLLDLAEIAPSPARVTEIVPVLALMFRLMLDLFKARLPTALPMLQVTALAAVLPSGH